MTSSSRPARSTTRRVGSWASKPIRCLKGKARHRQGFRCGKAFPEGGYYILGRDFETESEIRLIVDAGPLGYRAIAAHGHADALAFTLSVGGREFLIDPGTYAYHTQGPWRQYFRGTAAHNTVRVDGVDQSVSGGNFMWLKKAHAGCRRWSTSAERDVFDGWHDGYMRLGDPVFHRRRITLDKPARRFRIDDVLEACGEHEVELFFHCSELCSVIPIPQGYALSQGPWTLILRLPRMRAQSGAFTAAAIRRSPDGYRAASTTSSRRRLLRGGTGSWGGRP